MSKESVRLTEGDLHRIIKESIRQILTETYRGPLYHYTTLPLLYSILEQNNLIRDDSDRFCDYRRGTYDFEYDEPCQSLCFTRDKNYNIRNTGVMCRLVFDSEKLMQLRNARLYPVNWSGKAKINQPNEAEERLWGVNVYPLDKYVERIDIIISDLSDFDDGNCDYVDELNDKYFDAYYAKHPNADGNDYCEFLGKKIIQNIMRLKKFKGKINVVYNKKK